MKRKAKSREVARSSNGRRRAYFMLAFTIAIALGGFGLWYDHRLSSTNLVESAGLDGVERVTLDPQAFEGEARVTYRIARQHPELLAGLYCYCHCDTRLGHHNLLDCYRDSHAASCGICMGEAKDAEQMAKEGLTPEEIRATLKARYENQE